jgi:hypothetical protein
MAAGFGAFLHLKPFTNVRGITSFENCETRMLQPQSHQQLAQEYRQEYEKGLCLAILLKTLESRRDLTS